jgi:hypothetical protein
VFGSLFESNFSISNKNSKGSSRVKKFGKMYLDSFLLLNDLEKILEVFGE